MGLAKEFKCQVKVEHQCQISSTHKYTAACSDYFRSFFGCKAQCGVKLPCGHICQGKCGDCLGQHHPPCSAICGRQLQCLHRCKGKCGEPCKPCQETCSVACVHKICHNKCGQRCVPCTKPCSWSCAHYTCSKICAEECDREPCDEPCPLNLPCGHRCIGYCGEPCPPVCYFCNGAHLQQTLKDIRFTENTRCVQVFPCCHIVESNALKAWFGRCITQDKAHVCSILTCPVCMRQVSFCPRFGNVLKRNAREHERILDKLHQQEMKYQREIEEFQTEMSAILESGKQFPTFKTAKETNRFSTLVDIKGSKKQPIVRNALKEADWFSNPNLLVSHMMELQLGSLSRDNSSGQNVSNTFSDKLYLWKLYCTREENRSQPMRCKDLKYLLSCTVYFHKLARKEDSNKVVIEVLFSLFSGIKIKSASARVLLKSAVTRKDWEEKLIVQQLSLDTKSSVIQTWRQHLVGVTWVACAKGQSIYFFFFVNNSIEPFLSIALNVFF